MDRIDFINRQKVSNPVQPFEDGTFNFNVALGSLSIPPYWLTKGTGVVRSREDLEKLEKGEVGFASDLYEQNDFEKNTGSQVLVYSQMPLSIKAKTDSRMDWFTFPIEPLVSLSYKNIIVRRNVAKNERNGSIKERWSKDDYDITITGVLKRTDGVEEFPEVLTKRLLEIAGSPQSIDIMSDFLLYFGITSMAIESVNFPHTKGFENQNFEIRGYSDYSYNLLIEQ